MTAKDYLNRATKARAIITAKIAEIEHWKAIAESITAACDNVRVQTSGSGDSMATAAVTCADIQTDLVESVKAYEQILREMSKVIEALPVLHYQIIHGVYLEGKTLQDVADELDKSYSAITTEHGRALKKLDDIVKEAEWHDSE